MGIVRAVWRAFSNRRRFGYYWRICYYFWNDGKEEVYCASADWMPRNLDRRVEILFPIDHDSLKERILDMLKILLSDNVKAQLMQPDGTYERIDRRGKVLLCAQDYFAEEAKKFLETSEKKDENSRVFIPAQPQ